MNEPLTTVSADRRSRCTPDHRRPASKSGFTSSANLSTSRNGARVNFTQQPSHHAFFPASSPISHLHHHHHRHSLNIYLLVLILITTCCCSIATAQPLSQSSSSSASDSTPPISVTDPFLDEEISEVESLKLELAELAKTGTILIDQRPHPLAPVPAIFQLETIEIDIPLELEPRDSGDPFSGTSSSGSAAASSTAPAATKSSSPSKVAPTSSSSSSSPSSSSSSASTAAATSPPSPLPSPFDTTLGSNFTQTSCPSFINSFLNDPTFKSCLPFSMLLQSSNSFFQAAKSLVRITQTLDATCAASLDKCVPFLNAISNNLTTPQNCQSDYAAQNPVVLEIQTALIAYKPLYQASCLKNPSTGSYCFADAITNTSSPTDSYVYYLALNNSLPGASQPTCDSCLQNTMAVFNAAAANRSQPVASTYASAATQINVQCGPGFVNASIPAPVSSGAAAMTVGVDVAGAPVAALVFALAVAAWLF